MEGQIEVDERDRAFITRDGFYEIEGFCWAPATFQRVMDMADLK